MKNYTWIINSEGIYCDELDVQIKNNSEYSFPFYATYNYGVICGENGTSHSISVDGRESLCQMKAIKLFKEHGEYIKDMFPSVDMSSSTSRFSAMKDCAKIIEKDIFSEGRCFNLMDKYDQVVFLFWNNISQEEKSLIEEYVCKEKDFPVDNISEAIIPVSSPDSIVVDGKVYGYRNANAIPFIVFKDNEKISIKYGKAGEMHILITSAVKKDLCNKIYLKATSVPEEKRMRFALKKATELIEQNAITEGRYWILDEKIIFSFWDVYKSCSEIEIIKQICDEKDLDFDKTYTYKCNQLVKVSELNSYVPSDEDYAGMESNEEEVDLNQYYKEAKKKIRQFHNPEYIPGEGVEDREEFEKRKKEETENFRTDRDAVHDKELEYETPKNGYPKMTRAEYNHLTKMDESSRRKKHVL